VGQALAAPRERFERDDLLRSLDVAAQHLGDGTRAGLARSLGLRSKSTVTEWFTTGTAPSLEVMARAAALLGCPLEDLLTGRAVPRGGTTTIQAPARRAHRQHDWVMVASRLDAMLNEVAPPSVDEAMRRLEIDESTVRRRFPDQLRRLAAGARAARERRKVERRDGLVGIVVAACEEMRARGIYPGRRRIERLLPPGVSVREPTLRATWVAHRGDR
jgi:transcriptional regulator with XRE-family HTH domain